MEVRMPQGPKITIRDMVPLIALVVAITSFAVAQLERSKVALSSSVIFSPVVSRTSSGLMSGLDIRYRGAPVASATLGTIQIMNSGNVPIRKDAFDSPIEIRPIGARRVLDAKIAETRPAGLSTELLTADSLIQLGPMLLNPGDRVTIQAVLEGQSTNASVRARIAGVSNVQIQDRPEPISRWKRLWLDLPLGVVFALLFGFLMAQGSDAILSGRSLTFHWALVTFILLACASAGARLVTSGLDAHGTYSAKLATSIQAAAVIGGLLTGEIMRRMAKTWNPVS